MMKKLVLNVMLFICALGFSQKKLPSVTLGILAIIETDEFKKPES
jgi:hypothetical protein